VHRIQTLETALKNCQKELKEEKAKLSELKEHFKYNLRLLNDRDVELQRYDALFLGNIQHAYCSATTGYLCMHVTQKNLLCSDFMVKFIFTLLKNERFTNCLY